jgi:hypothetical protein
MAITHKSAPAQAGRPGKEKIMKKYVYEVETNKIVAEFGSDKEFQSSKYASWGDGDWNDAGLAVCNESSAAFGSSDGLHR